ncbi:MAG: molecular chaperone, partial [Pseudomonadota bacterium]
STYGQLIVTKPGVKQPVVVLRGVAIYPEIGEREVRIPLTAEQAGALAGPLRFEYREMPEAGSGLLAAVDAVIG